MPHPIEQFTVRNFSELEETDLPQLAGNDERLASGIYFSWDSEESNVRLSLSRAKNSLLTIDGEIEGEPRWLVLNIALGEALIDADTILGVVTSLTGLAETGLSMFVRTSRDGEMVDTMLSEGILGSSDPVVRVSLHKVTQADAMCGVVGLHTLVIKLPMQNFHLNLQDLRLFALKGEPGLELHPAMLGNIG